MLNRLLLPLALSKKQNYVLFGLASLFFILGIVGTVLLPRGDWWAQCMLFLSGLYAFPSNYENPDAKGLAGLTKKDCVIFGLASLSGFIALSVSGIISLLL